MISYETTRKIALSYKILVALIGIGLLVIAITFGVNEINFLTQSNSANALPLVDEILIIAIIVASLSAATLSSSIFNSLKKVKLHRPRPKETKSFQYGFFTVLAVGIGATLGSPLFILIPLNVIQYEFISILSLILATILSVLMAKVYANMYVISSKEKLGAVGGPSFTKVATGSKSLRYFLVRLSMFIGNTALAAYSAIVFVLFDFQIMPTILLEFGIIGLQAQVVIYSIAASFVVWFVLNSFFEHRLLRLIGSLQVLLTWIMMGILISQSVLLANAGSWNISGLFSNLTNSFSGIGVIGALITNTAFLYLLFFGFQEIQVLERDSLESSSIPIVSWIKKGYKMSKSAYFGVAMIASVLIAATINILYAIAVYSVHPSYSQLAAQQIPAIFLSKEVLGNSSENLMSFAFLIATFTTFVPAFMAATRHLASLSEDGFMPPSVGSVAWLFVLVSIALLAVAGENFLVNITDFMVLASLGLISLSAIWMKKNKPFQRGDVLPLLVGVSCFIAAVGVYFIQAAVVIFGSLAIVAVYLIYDIFALGDFGAQLFLAIFDVVVLIVLELYPHGVFQSSFSFFSYLLPLSNSSTILGEILAISAALLFVNVGMDLAVKRSLRRVIGIKGKVQTQRRAR